MKNSNRTSRIFNSMLVMLLLAAVCLPQRAAAQGLPSTLRGDAGLRSGTLPPPGLYISNLIYNYNFDTLVTNDGRKIEGSGGINQTFYGLGVTYVSEKKFLGANYSATFVLPLINFSIDTPRLDLSSRWSSSDMAFVPAQLGWHFKQADLTAAYTLFMPTGRFEPGGKNNTGFGQWGNEFSFGFTVYPSAKKAFHLATLASYDIQSEKKGTEQKVGDTLTLEGGAGAAFKQGLINAGVVYYTQWKLKEDRVPAALPAFRGKHRYLGVGPEFNYTWLIKGKKPVVFLFRYYFETENRVATEGDALVVGVTYVIPGKH